MKGDKVRGMISLKEFAAEVRKFTRQAAAGKKPRRGPYELELRVRAAGQPWQLAWAARSPSAEELAQQMIMWLGSQASDMGINMMRTLEKALRKKNGLFQDLDRKVQKLLRPHFMKAAKNLRRICQPGARRRSSA
jgi:hypothetical protein